MILRNTSKYPLADVRQLVEFAAAHLRGLDHSTIAVHVKNCGTGAYAGMAYERVPFMSRATAAATRLVTLRIGDEYRFPKDNMREHVRWVRVKPGEKYESHEVRSMVRRGQGYLERRVVFRAPYGGKGSPLIEVRNWRECLVAIAAHELNHCWQYQNNAPRSEVRCEKRAAEVLDAFREFERIKQ